MTNTTEPETARDWRVWQHKMHAAAEYFTAVADSVSPDMPRLLRDDYSIGLSRAYLAAAQVARDAADKAKLYADELTADAVPAAS